MNWIKGEVDVSKTASSHQNVHNEKIVKKQLSLWNHEVVMIAVLGQDE